VVSKSKQAAITCKIASQSMDKYQQKRALLSQP
jgi:hypothetical protein